MTVGRDAAGNPDGVLSGSPANVLNLTARIVPPPTLEEKKALIVRVQAQQHAMGLTGIRELQIHPDVMRVYFELWIDKALTMRTSVGLELNAGDEAVSNSCSAPGASARASATSGFASTASPNTTQATSYASPFRIGTARISASCASRNNSSATPS